MTPLVLAAAGVLAVALGIAVLRTFGPRYRIGRLLATTPRVSVAEALELAASGGRRYVRVDGRIDAEDEFEDADHRPLVFRRTRMEARAGRGWRVLEDQRQAVPFGIREGLDGIAIDHAALDTGLIVVPRESIGKAADLAGRAPLEVAGDTTVRARIDQISSVEHAIVLGVPKPVLDSDPAAADAAGGDAPAGDAPAEPRARMSAGLGRPLILSVLEPSEAMRLLAAGGVRRTRFAAACLAAGIALIAASLAWAGLTALMPGLATIVPGLAGLIPATLAASAEPSAVSGGDPRSNGQGPGLVGTPGIAIIGVILIGIVAVLVTTAYVRLTDTGDRRRRSGPPRR